MSSERIPRIRDSSEDADSLLKKCIRNYKKEMKMLEYSRLRSLVPSIALQPRVSKIEVIEEAIKYIAQLQETLAARFEGPSQDPNSPSREARRPKLVRQKRKRLASYMIKTQRHTLTCRPKLTGHSSKRQEQER